MNDMIRFVLSRRFYYAEQLKIDFLGWHTPFKVKQIYEQFYTLYTRPGANTIFRGLFEASDKWGQTTFATSHSCILQTFNKRLQAFLDWMTWRKLFLNGYWAFAFKRYLSSKHRRINAFTDHSMKRSFFGGYITRLLNYLAVTTYWILYT